MTRPRRRCTSSSQEIVLNDVDLLALILLHVPWRKLKVLKCVSKQWKSLITAPHFHNSLLLPLRASGLFIQRHLDFYFPRSDKVNYVPLDDPRTPSPLTTLTFAHERPFDPERMCILRSCNGLFLCSMAFYRAQFVSSASGNKNSTCYIYNPSTKQLATLPEHPSAATEDVRFVGLAYDPSKSLHYKVIAYVCSSALVDDGLHIYSSETGTWRASGQSFHKALEMRFEGGVYCVGKCGYKSHIVKSYFEHYD